VYVPTHFKAESPELIAKVVHENSFALLVTATDDGLKMSHVPCLFDPDRGENGTLKAHVARANDHWKWFDGRRETAAVFLGPHAYVSPTWYKEHLSVPTWNYAAVHLLGAPQVLGDEASLALLMEMVRIFEGPGSVYDFEAGEAYARKSLPGIVAFEMPVLRVNAKFKMSQNKPEGDRLRVIEHLAEGADPLAQATARFMRELGG